MFKAMYDKKFKLFVLISHNNYPDDISNALCTRDGSCNYLIKLQSRYIGGEFIDTENCMIGLECMLMTIEHEVIHLLKFIFNSDNPGFHDNEFIHLHRNIFSNSNSERVYS